MINLLKKLQRNLIIALIVFLLFIILFLSYIDVTRMNKQLKKDYADKIELAEMNVKSALRNLDEEYFQLDQKLANKMKANSEYISTMYEENHDFKEWNFEALKKQFNMDIYIINQANQVIYSSFSQDIGLDFELCCGSFANLLDERRKSGQFIHEGIDLQQYTGKLLKYSYMPTRDGKYLIELSYDLMEDPEFQHFDFITVMNELKRNYSFIKSVAIHNYDYYELNKSSIESLRTNTNKTSLEWFNTKSEIKELNYAFMQYLDVNGEDDTILKLVKINYNHNDLDEAMLNNRLTFLYQLIGMFALSVIVVRIMLKIIEKPMYLAFHDRLTGLKNRAAFENEINTLFGKRQKKFGILLLDFDHFKSINDTLGHDSGDLFLKFIATYIQKQLPTNTFFARFGGDEFTIILKDIQDEKELESVANQLVGAFNEPLSVNYTNHSDLLEKGFEMMQSKNITVSIGGAIFPTDGDDLDTLYKKADLALYYSKEYGKNRYTYYGDVYERQGNR